MRIAERITKIKPSATLAVSAMAAKLRAQGVDVIAFGVGEPDFDTPEHIKEATRQALSRGIGKYTPVSGTADLRAVIANELNTVHGTSHKAENIIVSSGAKHSLYNLMMCVVERGDEVVIPAPCWVSYPELVQMAEGDPVLVQTRAESGFALDPDQLLAAVGPRTRAIVLNSPCNPTGAVYTAEALAVLDKILVQYPDVFVIADDIYRKLVYGGQWISLPRLLPEHANRILLVDGVSKSYAMTGWRIGYFAGPVQLVAAMDTLQGQSTTNAAAIAQAAALAALTGTQAPIETMRQEFDRRRKAMVAGLQAIPNVRLVPPQGAFYCFPDFSAYLGQTTNDTIKDDLQLATYLLEKARVALVPGSGFMAPGFARLSYATSLANVEEGVRRISVALAELVG